MASIAIAGAGLLGRLLAWRLSKAGHQVSVFDPAPRPTPLFDGKQAAGFTAAGMLSPLAELDCAGPELALLGWRSMGLWRAITAALTDPTFLKERGSLLLAHRSDLGAAQRVLLRLQQAPADTPMPQALSAAQLAAMEPALHGAAHAWLLPGEGQICTVAAMRALYAGAENVQWHWGRRVTALRPHAIEVQATPGPARPATPDDTLDWQPFDMVFDVRGVGAKRTAPLADGDAGFGAAVRGVRGELIWLSAPGHGLTRPVRLLHPRHRVYIVPRPCDTVLVGASEVESEDRSAVSLRSAVELMTAAHSVLPALAEARILRMDRNLRPTLPDNLPRIDHLPGLVSINGLFRHGWLIAPALVEDALERCGLRPPALIVPAAAIAEQQASAAEIEEQQACLS